MSTEHLIKHELADTFNSIVGRNGNVHLPSHVIRSLKMLGCAIEEFTALDGATTMISRSEIVRRLSKNPDEFNAFRQRQLNLVEAFAVISDIEEDSYMSIDISVHISMTDAILRYHTAWARFFRRAELGFESENDLLPIDAALSELLAIAAIGYKVQFSDNCGVSKGHLENILLVSIVGVGIAYAAKKLPKLSLALRGLKLLLFNRAMVGAIMLVVTGFEVWDHYMPQLGRASSIIASIGYRGNNPPFLVRYFTGYVMSESVFGLDTEMPPGLLSFYRNARFTLTNRSFSAIKYIVTNENVTDLIQNITLHRTLSIFIALFVYYKLAGYGSYAVQLGEKEINQQKNRLAIEQQQKDFAWLNDYRKQIEAKRPNLLIDDSTKLLNQARLNQNNSSLLNSIQQTTFK